MRTTQAPRNREFRVAFASDTEAVSACGLNKNQGDRMAPESSYYSETRRKEIAQLLGAKFWARKVRGSWRMV